MNLCLSIAPASMEEALGLLRRIPPSADLVELRVDGITDLELGPLLRKKRRPLLVTNRRSDEGGKFRGSGASQVALLSEAAELGAEFVDVELVLGRKVIESMRRRHPGTGIVCSYHNIAETPSNLPEIFERMAGTGADVLKIATMANDITDCEAIFRLHEVARSRRRRFIGIAMGEAGTMTRILGPKFGAWMTFASSGEGSGTAPGQVSLEDLRGLYRVGRLNRSTRVFGLAGNPVSQSRGICFHNGAFARSSVNAVYVNFLVSDLPAFVGTFGELFTGLSITMPFKREIVKLLDRLDMTAAESGSVNTVLKRRGKLVGYNTDYEAIRSLLHNRIRRKSTAVILGTGATSRSMALAALAGGSQTTILGRSAEKARALARELQCDWGTMDRLGSLHADILMNGTPVGMTGSPDRSFRLPRTLLRRDMLVFDAVYRPEVTPLLLRARKTGCDTISGTEMFTRQAELQARLFLGACR